MKVGEWSVFVMFLSYLFALIFTFIFFLRKKGHEIGWVGMWERSGRSWGERKNLVKNII